MELGRDFMFVGSQQRMNIGKSNYYVDMVFYNKILKAYILIGDMKAEYALGGISTKVYSSKYVYYIPDKQLLIDEVKPVLKVK